MAEWFGLEVGTIFQGGTMVAMLALVGLVARAWILGAPERRRAETEAKKLENDAEAQLRNEMNTLHQKNRDDYHALANKFQALEGTQRKCSAALAEAHAENRGYRDDMNTLLFLIRLLISEVKRLDKEPDNIIIAQAEMTLEELERKRTAPPPTSVEAAAQHTVEAAEETLAEVKAGHSQ